VSSRQQSVMTRSSRVLLHSAISNQSAIDTVGSATATDDLDQDENQPNTAFRRIRTYCVKGVTARDGPLNEAVAQLLSQQQQGDDEHEAVSLEQANHLIELGAVWARMEALTQDELLALYDEDDDVSSSSRALYADVQGLNYEENEEEEQDLERYLEQVEQLRFRRVLSPSWIQAGTDLRIYPEPRRFTDACGQMQNSETLLYEDTTFVVVDKPPMLPTQPDASNYHECCPGCTQTYLGPFFDITGREIVRPLLCHRVDACVGGCVVMAKDRNGQKVFSQLQQDRQLRKVYLAVTTQRVPLGMHLHWMWAPQSARGKSGGPPCQLTSLTPPESRRKAREFWNRCILEVVKCEPISIDPQVLQSYPQDSTNNHNEPVQYYQSTIRLVTGRKHQVRAQLSALGCPIIGDTLYQPLAGLTLDGLEVNNGEEDLDDAVARARVPTQPIGLQAHAILFGNIRAKARAPWWWGAKK